MSSDSRSEIRQKTRWLNLKIFFSLGLSLHFVEAILTQLFLDVVWTGVWQLMVDWSNSHVLLVTDQAVWPNSPIVSSGKEFCTTYCFTFISGVIALSLHTVFPRIVVATTILFLGLRCDNYSRETTVQRRKLLFFFIFSLFLEVYLKVELLLH